MSYIDKINVNGTTYDLATKLSEIRDSNGNQRFIEGDGVNNLENIEVAYSKWSLSGTHLMIVFAFKIPSTQGTISLTANQELCAFFPNDFIRNKLFSIAGGNSGVLSRISNIKPINQYGDEVGSGVFGCYVYKENSRNAILFIATSSTTIGASATESYVRIQADFIIDTE